MRFLKDIIARKANAALDEYHADMELDDEEYAEWPEGEDDLIVEDEVFEDEPTIASAPVHREEPAPAPMVNELVDDIEADLSGDEPEQPDQDDLAVKIWEMFSDDEEDSAPDAPVVEEPEDSQSELAREALKSMVGGPPVIEKPAPADKIAPEPALAAQEKQPVQRAGRVKTRMLGFHSPEQAVPKVFDRAETKSASTDERFPVGWLVVIEGPGRGTSFPLHCGVSTVGRGTDQIVRLDFGDNSISRDSHAVIAYDEDTNGFYVGHTGKANLVRLNGRPVLSTEEISNFDLIRIGETTLRFAGFCGPEFAWDMTDDEEIVHARAG